MALRPQTVDSSAVPSPFPRERSFALFAHLRRRSKTCFVQIRRRNQRCAMTLANRWLDHHEHAEAMGLGRFSIARPFDDSASHKPPHACVPSNGDRRPVEKPTSSGVAAGVIESDVPARLERLPRGPFHTLVVVALGVTWILDGLEVTLAGALAGALKQSPILRFSSTDVGFVSSAYLAGAVLAWISHAN